MGIWEPFPLGTMSLVLEKSRLSLQGVEVLPEVVNSDYLREIHVVVQLHDDGVFEPGDYTAQLSLLPPGQN